MVGHAAQGHRLRKAQVRRIGGIGLLLTLAGWCASGQPLVTASVERGQVTVNEPFRVSISAQGQRVAEPVIPHADGLRFDRTPLTSTSSTQFSMSTGRGTSMTNQREWTYNAWATREGTLTIPPISVRIDGKQYQSDPIRIRAVAAGATPSPQIPSDARGAQNAGQNPASPTVEDAILIETNVDKKRVYQGETLVLSLRILQIDIPMLRTSYRGGASIPLPSTEGFYSGPLIKMERRETRNGWNYNVIEHRMPLCPTGSGTFTIGGWSWMGEVSWFSGNGFQSKYRSVEAPPIEIIAIPLPDRPENFSGAVGRFQAKASLMKGEVVQGVSTQLQIRVTGEGNPDAILAPALPAIPWAHLSDPETKASDTQDWSNVEKVFTYNITPLETGNLTIPGISFCYFAPATGQYVTETVKPFSVFVRPSGESQQLVAVGGVQAQQEKQVEIIGEDVLPIVLDAGRLHAHRPHPALNTLAIAAPPVLWGLFFAFLRRQRRLGSDSAYARGYYAAAKARKRLQGAVAAREPSEELFHALTGYLADRFNVSEAGMTSSDARRLLESRINDAELIDGVVKVLRTCERSRYGGGELGVEEVQALFRGAESILERLEAGFGKGGRS